MFEVMEKGRKGARARTDLRDIGISRVSNGNGRRAINIYFRNECLRLITSGDRLSVGVDGKRLYFIADDGGYSVVSPREWTRIRRVSICDPVYVERLEGFCGEYDLRRDTSRKMYYVEV